MGQPPAFGKGLQGVHRRTARALERHIEGSQRIRSFAEFAA